MRAMRWSFSRTSSFLSAVLGTLAIGGFNTEIAHARFGGVGTAFTYQGQLKQGGDLVNATADFQFTLFDALAGGTAVSGPLAGNNVSVVNGLFTVELDFGTGVFINDGRWLNIAVRSPAGGGGFSTLSPRQKITPAPLAHFALNANGPAITNLNAGNISTGTLADARLSSNVALKNASNTFTANNIFNSNVGIGLAAPANRLHVQTGSTGSAAHPNALLVLESAMNQPMLQMISEDDSPSIISFQTPSGNADIGYNLGAFPGALLLRELNAGTQLILRDGNVGVNTIDPETSLHVVGTTSVMFGNLGIGTTTPAFQLHLSSNSAAKPTSNTWTISSDARLKKNIHTIENALDDLMALRGVTYQWIDPSTQGDMAGTYTGMIAQEVEEVFPEWVREDANGYKTLTVTGFEGIAVEAMRELRAEKDTQIAALRDENAELRARVETLERMMKQVITR